MFLCFFFFNVIILNDPNYVFELGKEREEEISFFKASSPCQKQNQIKDCGTSPDNLAILSSLVSNRALFFVFLQNSEPWNFMIINAAFVLIKRTVTAYNLNLACLFQTSVFLLLLQQHFVGNPSNQCFVAYGFDTKR